MADVLALNIVVKRDESGALSASIGDMDKLDKASGRARSGVDELSKVLGPRLGGALQSAHALQERFALGMGSMVGVLAVAAAAIAAAVAGVIQLARAFASYASQLTDVSARTGIATDAIQELTFAGSLVGVSFDQTANAINLMQRRLVEAREGSGEAADAFRRLGVSAEQLIALRPDEAFREIQRAIAGLPTDTEKAAAAMQLFGRGGAQLLPLLKSNLADVSQEARDLGLVIGEDAVQAGDDFDDAMTRLQASAKALGLQLGSLLVQPEIVEGITGLARAIGFVARTIDENRETLEFLARLNIFAQAGAAMRAIREAREGAAAGEIELPEVTVGMPGPTGRRGEVVGAGAVELPVGIDKMVTALGRGLPEAAKKSREEVKALDEQMKRMPEAVAEAETAIIGLAQAFGFYGAALEARTPEETQRIFGLIGPGARDAGVAMGELAESTRLWGGVSALSDRQLITLIDSMREQALQGGENEEGFRVLSEAMDEAAERGGHVAEAAGFAGERLAGMSEEEQEAARQAEELREKLERLAAVSSMLGQLGDALGELGGLLESLGVSADSALGRAVGGMQELTNAAQQGIGAFASFASGDIIGGITQGIGALGSAFRGIGRAFGIGGDPVIMEVNDMRDAFFEAQGGFEELARTLTSAGVEAEPIIRRIFDAKTPEEFEAATRAATDALAAHEDFLRAQEEATQKVRAAMERYGLTIEQMGPKFRQQELDKQALSLLEDYKLLIAAGADNVTVITAMGPAMSEYVNAARAAGTTIPSALRPVIEQMIAQGLLLDENGEAFESVEDAGLSFAETMEESMSRVADQIERLVNALLGVQDVASQGIDIPVRTGDVGDVGPGAGGRPSREMDLPQAQAGLLVPPRAAVVAQLHGGTGGELVAPVQALAREIGAGLATRLSAGAGPSGGAQQPIVLQVYIGGQKLDDVIVRRQRAGYIPQER